MIRNGRTLLWGVIFLFVPGILWAQEAEQAPSEAELSQMLRKVIGRLDKVEQELRELRLENAKSGPAAGNIPDDPEKRQLYLQMQTPYYGPVPGSNEYKYLAINLSCLNLTDEPFELNKESLSLFLDGTEYKHVQGQDEIRNQAFQSEGQSFQLKNLPILDKVTIPSGAIQSTWVLFDKLPYSQSMPEMRIVINSESKPPFEFSLNDAAEGRIDLELDQIGPRDSLGLVTVNGIVDNLTIGVLVQKITALTNNKVSRFVLRFSETASISDMGLHNWLITQANSSGSNIVGQLQHYPPFPASIRELHLAELPDAQNRGNRYRSNIRGERIHGSTEEAVEEALKSVYENLPRNELVEDIKSGHLLTRVVAVKHGGARLMDDQLPLIVEMTEADDPEMQKAALYALRHFNNQDAFDKLEEYVRKNIEGLSSIAIDSLAASRFGEAHQRLLKILNNEPPSSKTEFVKILAENPRPIWSETIYEFLNDESSNEYRAEALQALNRIGHPKLLEVLKESLQNRDDEIRQIAFAILASRNEPESEQLALEYTLQYIAEAPPTEQMRELIMQTKSQEAIPLLIPHLEKSNADRRNILLTLSQIGDQNVASKMIEIYPKLNPSEQATVLGCLWELKSPAAFDLSKQALNASDHNLLRSAVDNLAKEGSEEAVDLLVDTFKTTTNRSASNALMAALGDLATPDARDALREASIQEGTGDKATRSYQYLMNIWRESPAYQYISLANSKITSEDGDDSKIKPEDYENAMPDFTKATEVDPQLPMAWSSRGNAFLKLEKYTEAKQDFAKAMEIDPRDQMAITGTALVLVREDEAEAAFELIDNKERFFEENRGASTGYFAYNTACVYGVALEMLRKKAGTEEAPENLEQLEKKYEDKAINALKRSVRNQFDQLDWMRKDPDLNSLHDNEEFRKISEWPAEG